MDGENNIIILATYWNERRWIEPSLEQIDVIDPVEVIICDGCFDPRKQNRSTDGTREIINEFVEGRENARMISAERTSTPGGLIRMAMGHSHTHLKNMFRLPRINLLYTTLRTAAYRRNQAITFNHMISVSEKWKPGRWFMTYDADQFYTDEMIEKFGVTGTETDIGLLTGTEYTFFSSFDEYTTEYEQRTYNNMPHKIYPDTIIQPTRGLSLEGPTRTKTSLSDQWCNHHYIDHVDSKNIGRYHHYKIPDIDKDRFQQGYNLGDRKMPDVDEYTIKEFTQSHPRVIKNYIDV
jgi:hypothetical protein